MTTVQSYDNIIARISNGYSRLQPLYEYTTGLGGLFSTTGMVGGAGFSQKMPGTLPSGVSSFFVTAGWNNGALSSVPSIALIAKWVPMGSLNISTNVFTDGSAMPTATELGATNTIPGMLLAVATTAITGTPGSLGVTYRDQNNNTAETTSAQAMSAAVAGSAGLIILNTTDWGVVDITNMVRSGGSTPVGTIALYGLIPIGVMPTSGTTSVGTLGIGGVFNGLTDGFIMTQLGAGDLVGIIRTSSSLFAPASMSGTLYVVGDS